MAFLINFLFSYVVPTKRLFAQSSFVLFHQASPEKDSLRWFPLKKASLEVSSAVILRGGWCGSPPPGDGRVCLPFFFRNKQRFVSELSFIAVSNNSNRSD